MPMSIKSAWLNLQRNSRRSALSILIIAVVVFALCCTGGFGLYTYQSLMKETAMSIGHITLSQPNYFEQEEDIPLENGLSDYSMLGKKLSSIPGIHAIMPRIEFNGLISNGRKSTIYMGTGIDPQEFAIKGEFVAVKSGKALSPRHDDPAAKGDPEVMLGANLAQNLKVTVGDVVTLLSTTTDGVLNAMDFKVQSIFSTGVPELDKRQLYINIAAAQVLLATHKVSTLSVYLFETQQTAVVQKGIDEKLNMSNHLELTAKTAGETYAKIQLWLDAKNDFPLKADLYLLSQKMAKQAIFTPDNPLHPQKIVSMTLLDSIQPEKQTVIDYQCVVPYQLDEKYYNPAYLIQQPRVDL